VQQPEIAALHDMNFGFSDKKLRPSNRVRKIAFGPDTGPFGNAWIHRSLISIKVSLYTDICFWALNI